MTIDPIFIVSSIITFLILVGLYILACYIDRLTARLSIQEAEFRQLWSRVTPLEIALAQVRSTENQNALDICRIGDMTSDTFAEVTAHARVLDNHTDRLSALEGEQ